MNASPAQLKASHVRWMIRRDLPDVLAIEQLSFAQPWTEDAFLAQLRCRDRIGMVAEIGETVAGYMLYQLCEHHIYVRRLAVHPKYRRMGIGRQLSERAFSKLSSERRNRVVIHVRESNLDAQRWISAVGWRAVRVARRFFEDTGEDAYRFVLRCEGD